MEAKNELKDCICIEAPMGANGLEGYVPKETYKYQRMEKDKHGDPYYRVFPDKDFTDYYETCGVGTFRKYFCHYQ